MGPEQPAQPQSRLRLIGWMAICYLLAAVAAAIVSVSLALFSDETSFFVTPDQYLAGYLAGIMLVVVWTAIPATLVIWVMEKRNFRSVKAYALAGTIASAMALFLAVRGNITNFPFDLLAAVLPGGLAGGLVFGWLRLRYRD